MASSWNGDDAVPGTVENTPLTAYKGCSCVSKLSSPGAIWRWGFQPRNICSGASFRSRSAPPELKHRSRRCFPVMPVKTMAEYHAAPVGVVRPTPSALTAWARGGWTVSSANAVRVLAKSRRPVALSAAIASPVRTVMARASRRGGNDIFPPPSALREH